MPEMDLLTPDDWPRLRNIRLRALLESPDVFLSRYEDEIRYDEERWRAEFKRGDWYIGSLRSAEMSLVGVTREPDTPGDQCYIEYLWVSPRNRSSGIALTILTDIIENLRKSGVRTVYLWVLDGNDIAVHLYKRVGFVSTSVVQPLDARPGRFEEKMMLALWEPRDRTGPA